MDAAAESLPAGRSGARRALPWALFLASSWTWCIGMFLPVLLVRDFGTAGWIVFAAPNVAGAAAMAWVLRDAEASRRLAWRHERAGLWFSLVTIAFHVFFAAWFVRLWAGPAVWAIPIASLLLLASGARRDLGSAAVAAAISIACAAAYSADDLRHAFAAHEPAPLLPRVELLGLAVACAVGFSLCPYLDLTFHRARQSTGGSEGRAAFALGFGVVFLLMIGLALVYAPHVGIVLGVGNPAELQRYFVATLGIHWIVQSIITLSLHLREVARRMLAVRAIDAVAAAALMVVAVVAGERALESRPPLGENVYRAFMGFYALVFPGYVWLRIVRGRAAGWWWVAVALAAPAYGAGFFGGSMLWVLPGAAALLVGGWALPGERPAGSMATAQSADRGRT